MFSKLINFFSLKKKKLKKKSKKFYKKLLRNSSSFFFNTYLNIKNNIISFLEKHPEYIDIHKERSSVEKRNVAGFFLAILSFLFWFDLLGLETGPGKQFHGAVWHVISTFGGFCYFFYGAKGFKGMLHFTRGQWHWYGTIIVSIYEWIGYMYQSFSYIEYLNNKKPFAYILKLANNTLMRNKKSLPMLGFGCFTILEWVVQFWKSYFLYVAWTLIYYGIYAFFFIVFGIELW